MTFSPLTPTMLPSARSLLSPSQLQYRSFMLFLTPGEPFCLPRREQVQQFSSLFFTVSSVCSGNPQTKPFFRFCFTFLTQNDCSSLLLLTLALSDLLFTVFDQLYKAHACAHTHRREMWVCICLRKRLYFCDRK